MDEPSKPTPSFLLKFRGKTNKISKDGLNHALSSHPTIVPKDESKLRPKRLISLEPVNHSMSYAVPKSESYAGGISQRRPLLPVLTKRSTDTTIRASKLQPLPHSQSLNDSGVGHQGFLLPPSRSNAEEKQKYKRPYGKYLKLDDQAMRHFQFLLKIEEKRNIRKSSAIFSQR